MLEHMNTIGKCVGGVVGQHLALGLEDYLATIYLLIYVVYGYTAFAIAIGKNSLMYVMTVHTGTAMQG